MATRRRVIGAGAALAIGALLAIAAWRDDDAREIRDGASGIELRYPAGWRVQRLGPYCMRGNPGVLVSNVEQRFRHETISDGCTTAFDLSGLPERFVLVEIRLFAFPHGLGGRPDVPRALDDLERSARPGCRGCTQYAGGASSYVVRIVFGPRASAADKEAVERILASLKLEGVRRG